MVRLAFLKNSLNFAILQAFRKSLEVIDRLEISLRGFARISAPSFKNIPERMSMPAVFDILYFLKNFLLRSKVFQ